MQLQGCIRGGTSVRFGTTTAPCERRTRVHMKDFTPASPPEDSDQPPGLRLSSWKEIATYVKRDVSTVQRWEKREAMPVHRHLHDKRGSVFAFRSELDVWARGRHVRASQEGAMV